MIRLLFLMLLYGLMTPIASAQKMPNTDQTNSLKRRVASILISETFLNEQLALHSAKSELFRNLKVDFDPESDRMYLRGILQLPLDDFRAMNIDPNLATFKFQLTIKPRVSKRGLLVLEFPLSETFFYQANSKNPQQDRVIIPVQLLSLGLASARGYLAALSGDFSSFERKRAKLTALLRGIKRSLTEESNEDALASLKNEKRSLELQIESLALEREQLERTSKSLSNIMGFTGEKEFNLNNEIIARKNALILKMKFSKIIPYLKDVTLGGVRVSHNKRDGSGEDYFVIDVHSLLAELPQPTTRSPRAPRTALKVAPSLQIRMNEAIFNSKVVVEAEKTKMSEDIKNFEVSFKEDGIHVSGKWRKYLFNIPFDSTVDFVSTGPDVFEVRLRQLRVYGMSLKFLTKYALDAMKNRLDQALKGICTFEYLGDKEESKVLQVTVTPKNLVPAFPDLHLVDVDVRDRNFTLRIGRIDQEAK